MPTQHPSPLELNQQVIEEFRANGGRVGGMFEGARLLLLTTTGARTGRRRTTPVAYARDGDRLLVFGTNAGGPAHPAWYHNAVAHPAVTVEIGTDDGRVDRFPATAEPLRGAERDTRFRAQCERDPAFAAYEAATTRVIPVVALHRADPADAARNRAIGAFLLRVHGELRAELASLRTALAEGPASAERPRAPALGRRLATHCLTLCASLHGHHTNEDGAFAGFERQFPELRPAIARLRREHETVARAVDGIETLVGRLSTEPAGADTDRLRAEVDLLCSALEAHFAYEEEQLLPALLGPAGEGD
ncbi:nitroreductase/quinone reductase family protein [Streptomyces sp. NPDC046727]|uniref:nitroreductase/quinone reductase family protein n=1 Tax=Streptomyces sp. NPDC046727 TaxID=3155373 RepID=UPI0033F0E5DA